MKDFNKVDTPPFWNEKYIDDEISWDLSAPTPAFVHWFKNLNKNKKIIVPGSGNGHDAIYLAELGHSVYAVDFSLEAIKNMKKNNVNNLHVILDNYFNLSKKFDAQFDYFLEYTFFCAINPERRLEYIEKAYNLLKPGGVFVGMLIPVVKSVEEAGPPFGVNVDDTIEMFATFFNDIKIGKTKFSIVQREDRELFITMAKHA